MEHHAKGAAVLVLRDPISPSDIDGLCKRARALLRDARARTFVCDVREVRRPDAVTVDALARLQLTVKRCGSELRLVYATDELLGLIDLAGLADVVPIASS